jgi:hypothetical protein
VSSELLDNFLRTQPTPLAGRQVTKPQTSNPDPPQPHDLAAQRLEHSAQLPLAPLGQHYAQPALPG